MEHARKKDRGKKEQNCSVTKPFKYTRCQGLARFPAAVKSLWLPAQKLPLVTLAKKTSGTHATKTVL